MHVTETCDIVLICSHLLFLWLRSLRLPAVPVAFPLSYEFLDMPYLLTEYFVSNPIFLIYFLRNCVSVAFSLLLSLPDNMHTYSLPWISYHFFHYFSLVINSSSYPLLCIYLLVFIFFYYCPYIFKFVTCSIFWVSKLPFILFSLFITTI